LVHEGGAHIVPAGGGVFDFFRRDGRPIPASPRLRRGGGLRIVPADPRSLGEGDRYDLGLTIDALLGAKELERLRLGRYGEDCLGVAA
jgi:hypothetical protein